MLIEFEYDLEIANKIVSENVEPEDTTSTEVSICRSMYGQALYYCGDNLLQAAPLL